MASIHPCLAIMKVIKYLRIDKLHLDFFLYDVCFSGVFCMTFVVFGMYPLIICRVVKLQRRNKKMSSFSKCRVLKFIYMSEVSYQSLFLSIYSFTLTLFLFFFRHAEVMMKIISTVQNGGGDVGAHMYLFHCVKTTVTLRSEISRNDSKFVMWLIMILLAFIYLFVYFFNILETMNLSLHFTNTHFPFFFNICLNFYITSGIFLYF